MVTIESIIKRLGQLGYVATEEDRDIIEFELEKILNYVKNYCNITEIPEILEPRIVDRVSGEFLFYQKNSGNLTGFDYDAVIKEIKEGDTDIKYAIGQEADTPESRFDSMVKQLERGMDKWLTKFRRIRW
jgi:hypothetical protein